MDLQGFAEDTARQASSRKIAGEHEIEQCRRYLDVVYHSYASRAGTSGSSGAIILQVTDGGLQNVVLPDLLDVLRTPRQIFERVESLSLKHELSLERELFPRYELSLERERYPAQEIKQSSGFHISP